MKTRYTISLIGCDDTTEFVIDLSESEKSLVDRFCELANEASTYNCMPKMEINPIEDSLQTEEE